MKKILLLTFVGLMFWIPAMAQYCTSIADSNLFHDITQVKITSSSSAVLLNNNTGLNSLSGTQGTATGLAGRYSDFTASTAVPITKLIKGSSYPLTIKFKGDWGIRVVYFDWNQDGDFIDTFEKVIFDTFNSLDTLKIVSFSVPSTAKNGKTRMRVIYRNWDVLPQFTSCGMVDFPIPTPINEKHGETEDYSVEIDDCDQFLAYVSNISHPKCFGQASGSISVNATGGTPPYTYNWSNGNKTIQNSNLLRGTYRITVSDKNGCTATMSSEIMDPKKLSLTIIKSSSNSLEALVSGGTITAAVGYSYSWNNGQPSVNKIINLPKGLYCVTVTDVNGCNILGCDSVVGSGSSNLNSIHPNILSIYPNPTQNLATIEVNLDKSSKLSYSLFNIQGKLIRQEELTNKAIGNVKQEINLEGLNSGIYILNLSINGKETSLKVVKE